MDYKQKAQEIREARRALYEEAGKPWWHPIWMQDLKEALHRQVARIWNGGSAPIQRTRGILCQMAAAAILDYTPPPYESGEFWKLLREIDDV